MWLEVPGPPVKPPLKVNCQPTCRITGPSDRKTDRTSRRNIIIPSLVFRGTGIRQYFCNLYRLSNY